MYPCLIAPSPCLSLSPSSFSTRSDFRLMYNLSFFFFSWCKVRITRERVRENTHRFIDSRRECAKVTLAERHVESLPYQNEDVRQGQEQWKQAKGGSCIRSLPVSKKLLYRSLIRSPCLASTDGREGKNSDRRWIFIFSPFSSERGKILLSEEQRRRGKERKKN
jgi:hypothetical protein